MSSENRDEVLQESPVETTQELQTKRSKLSYSREYLISLGELDVCKKLPDGFDASLLSEFEDCSNSTLEWQRSLGGLPLQSSRHNDYGSLPPYRSDSSSSYYPRGSATRWDTRSSGSSERAGDLQPDRDMQGRPDSGRRFLNQPRRSGQHLEHDGLLGSGAFPRPSGFAGASATRPRGNDHYQLNKSTEPYQPPRPYKAVPYSRKENTDSINDETFGSSECTSEDKVEEERKRRASFELMRKEQQKALQEKQKHNPDSKKEKLGTDIIALLEKSEHVKNKKIEEKSDISMASSLLQNGSYGLASNGQTPASRPLVPPGFASAKLEKNLSAPPLSTPIEDAHNLRENNILRDNILAKKDDTTAGIEAIKDSVGLEIASLRTSALQESNIIWEQSLNDLSSKKETTSKTDDTVNQDQSASILEKLFGDNSIRNNVNSPHFSEHQGAIADKEILDSAVSNSSKFAHWFLKEENQPTEDFSSSNLLSLIVSNEKVGSQLSVVSNDRTTEHIPPTVPGKNDDVLQKILAFPPAPSVPESYFQGDKQDSSSGVFTCEDLEQSILAEAKESNSGLQHSISEHWTSNSEGRKSDVDDRASQHLLYLLQGTNTKELASHPKADGVASFCEPGVSDSKASSNFSFLDSGTVKSPETIQNSEKTLTLEVLFGPKFMSELQSVGAPVSAQRGSVGGIEDSDVAQPHRVPFPQETGVFFSSTSGEHQSDKIVHEVNSETFSHIQEVKVHKIPGLRLGHEESIFEGSRNAHKGNEEGAFEIQLPEEDSLITMGDSLHPTASDSSTFRNVSRSENLLPGKTPEELNTSVLNTILRAGGNKIAPGLGTLPVSNGPYDLVGSDDLCHFHGKLPAHYSEQVNHMRAMIPHMDDRTHRNPQMKFMGPESIHHNALHPFPPNFIPQHAFANAATPRFERPPHHPVLQHMSIPENFPPQHVLQSFPRGVPLSHPMSHMPGYMPEINNLHGIPLNHRQPTYGVPGIGMQGSGVGGGGNPEVLQRLIELELRANPKQIHPAAAGHIPGIFSPEVDMGFRYR